MPNSRRHADTRVQRVATRSTPSTLARPAYLIESVDSALQLLRTFREVERVRVSEAARKLGVAPSTAHRLLAMLEYHGFVARDARTHEYSAGEELVRIGLAAATRTGLREQAKPIIDRLAATVNETVGLGVLRGSNMFYLDGAESSRTLRIVSRAGALLPCHTVSMGKILLAALSPAELSALYPNVDLERITDRTLRTKSALVKQLAAVRATGFASSSAESEEGVASIAVGVSGASGDLRAALSVAAPTERATAKNISEWLPHLRAAAKELSARIL